MNTFRSFACLGGFALFLSAAPLLFSQATTPAGMSYLGRITDASGNSMPDGTGYEIEVRLWTASTGGTTPIWGARYAGVPVKAGAFNLVLGAPGGTAIGGAISDLKTVFTTSPATHLGVTVTKNANGSSVASPTEILPRQQLLSFPYAFRAELAARADIATTADINAVNQAAIQDGAVLRAKIQAGAVDGTKIAGQSVASAHIVPASIEPDRLAPDYAIFVDQKSKGVGGGQSIAGSWQKRSLNTVAASMGSSITLSNSTITLQPGTYLVEGDAPAFGIGRTCAAVRKGGTTTIVIQGTSDYTQGSYDHSFYMISVRSVIRGQIVVSSQPETFEIWQFTEGTIGTGDLGVPVNVTGAAEVYTSVKITRIR